MSFILRDQLQRIDLLPEQRAEVERKLRISEKTLGERYHERIEQKGGAILRSLRQQDTSFYEDNKQCGDFLYYLCNQYFRTAKMRNTIMTAGRQFSGHDPKRTGYVECHLYATNVSAALFVERRAYKISFLLNATAKPFITGDQPVINLLDPRVTNDLELFYPLAPDLAMILSKDHQKFITQSRKVTEIEVEFYNHSIYEWSEDQLYSNDKTYLEALVTVDKHFFHTL